jgi:2-oxoisovalerate dehydrogenase E1 component
VKQDAKPTLAERICIEAKDQDWDAMAPSTLLWMLQQMILIRRFEEKLVEMKSEDLIHGPVHTSVGQEALAVGVATALRQQDKITGTHRAHHQYLAKVLCACAPDDFNPLQSDLTATMDECVRVLLCEIMGLREGCSGGRGGSMHLFHKEFGVAGTNAIVSGGVPHATGIAWADRFQGRDDVTVCFFGDGGVYQGVTHKASNLAALWNAPVIYCIENNRYAVATHVDDACSARQLTDVAAAYGMPGIYLNGMDPVEVLLGIQKIVARRDEGWLPCYVEADVYRFLHHAGDLPGSAFGYREKDEETEWRERCPIALAIRHLTRLGQLTDQDVDRLETQAARSIAKAVEYTTEVVAEDKRVVRESLWPTADSLHDGMRDDGPMTDGPFVESEDLETEREIVYSDAIAAATGRWMELDPNVVVIGEEVANFRGGAYGATKALPAKYPDRILNTPISEAGFCGLACGAAMNGVHPIVEVMFTSFALVAADQLLNQAGQLGHIYGGNITVPLVARTRLATGLGYGAQHSMDPTALFAMFPGWRIFVPTTPFDYIGLFNAAMKSKSPTLLLEHQAFYGTKGMIPADDLDYVVQPGKAKIVRSGSDVTVVTHGWMVPQSLEAAEILAAEGIEAEVLDLRTLDDAGLDYEAIGASLDKTGVLVTVEQASRCNSIGSKIARECEQRFFDFLDGPTACVASSRAGLDAFGGRRGGDGAVGGSS